MPEKRLTAPEYQAFLSLVGSYSELEHHYSVMDSRARMTPYAYGLIRSAKGSLKRSITELMRTIPKEKLKSMEKDFEHVLTFTRVTYTDKTQEDAYRWTNANALDAVVSYAVQYQCGMCDKCGAELSKCEFRKFINQLYPFDIAIARNGFCSLSGCFGQSDFFEIVTKGVEECNGDNS